MTGSIFVFVFIVAMVCMIINMAVPGKDFPDRISTIIYKVKNFLSEVQKGIADKEKKK